MRVTSTTFFLASLAASSLATVDQIKADIAAISSALHTVDTSITAFPTTGGTLAQALTIHTNAVNMGTSLNRGTTDANGTSGPVAEADGRSILTSVEALESVMDHALTEFVAKRAAFQALPIGGIPALIKQDINNVCTDVYIAFQNALLALYPADLVAEATALKNRIGAACATAIAAYANV